jgi:hypothetical protein
MAAVRVARALTIAVIAWSLGCSGDRGLRERVGEAEATERAQRAQTAQVQADASVLLSAYDETSRMFAAAEQQFQRARVRGGEAAAGFAAAEADYRAAERNWRWMTYIMLAAASYDLAGEICAGVESTQQYRQRNGLVGNSSICVDHSFAHALGGINHPWNYAPLDCRVNSSYGAAFWPKLVNMPVDVLKGLAVSALARLRCGSSAAAWRR